MSEHKSSTEQIANKCRHFNGIQHDTCKAGIRYLDVREITLSGRRWPCFKDDGCSERCAAVSYFTEQEATELGAKQDAAVAAFLTELAEGKTCPHCHAPIEKRYQVGRCVYAKPCGCRQYQGKVPESERTPKDTRKIEEQSSLWGGFEEK